ncbi:iron complex outermembrane receptor protein [Oxalobacteraceae bacterium GrIS 1.11]
MKYPKHLYPLAIAACISTPLLAQEDSGMALPQVRIVGQAPQAPANAAGSDSSQLLGDIPGYGTAAGGGVSGLPVINGFADDRIKIRIDGMEITSACANHMNPPLSYIDPRQVGKIKLIAGITPVSVGGDSLGGTIEVASAAPEFAARPGEQRSTGSLSISGRSVDHGVSTAVTASVASDSISLAYSGARARAASYKDGNGDKVLDSLFQSDNQAITVAARGANQQLTLRLGTQRIAYQGFPNQYMDMTGNHSTSANLAYAGAMAWGKLDARIYFQDTQHEMGFFNAERLGNMPMTTHGHDRGYALQAELPLQQQDVLRLGNEYHSFRLDDNWPAVPGSMMMGPLAYVNINDGKRDRLAFYAEWDHKLDSQWSSQLGVRAERVTSDTGQVQPYGYGMMNATDAKAAAAFNGRDHARRDNNLDLTALLRFEASPSSTYELGYARKTRSPNLYERYSWGRGSMAMTMINWFGDGNGYVGDIDLKPEVAHTISATANWHDADRWNVTASPYFSYVKDDIDTDVISTFHPYRVKGADSNLLRFANHDARLYGVNLSWKMALWQSAAWGRTQLKGNASLTRGSRTDGGNLYHMTPFNAALALEQAVGAWTNLAEVKVMASKERLDSRRLEPRTAGYALFNLRTAYQSSEHLSVTAGISNVFNKRYADPLGGVYLSGLASSRSGALQALPGVGRSFNLGVSSTF